MSNNSTPEFTPKPFSRGEKAAFIGIVALPLAAAAFDWWRERKHPERSQSTRKAAGDYVGALTLERLENSLRMSERPKLHLEAAVPKGSRLFVIRHGAPMARGIHETSIEHLKTVTAELFRPDRPVSIVSSPTARTHATAAELAKALESNGVAVDGNQDNEVLHGFGPEFNDDFISGFFGEKPQDVVFVTHEPVLLQFAEATGNLGYRQYAHLSGYEFNNLGEESLKVPVPGQTV